MMTMIPEMPPRIAKLPRHRIMGMDAPVPWFVTWFKDGQPCHAGEGTPDFRVADSRKFVGAVKHKLCWVCGEPLGRHMAFVIGPMCAINRISSEPPSHHDCALFSVRACPFLTRPRMRRNEKDLPDQHVKPSGVMISRNPGVSAIWVTHSYQTFKPQRGNEGVLVRIGEPTTVLWFAEGRAATRKEILESIDGGYPQLLNIALQDGTDAVEELAKDRERAMALLPAA